MTICPLNISTLVASHRITLIRAETWNFVVLLNSRNSFTKAVKKLWRQIKFHLWSEHRLLWNIQLNAPSSKKNGNCGKNVRIICPFIELCNLGKYDLCFVPLQLYENFLYTKTLSFSEDLRQIWKYGRIWVWGKIKREACEKWSFWFLREKS